jgi:hypothetical protein
VSSLLAGTQTDIATTVSLRLYTQGVGSGTRREPAASQPHGVVAAPSLLLVTTNVIAIKPTLGVGGFITGSRTFGVEVSAAAAASIPLCLLQSAPPWPAACCRRIRCCRVRRCRVVDLLADEARIESGALTLAVAEAVAVANPSSAGVCYTAVACSGYSAACVARCCAPL